jgi:chitin disaccharide deacetylase
VSKRFKVQPMPVPARVIVTGDDFGASSRVNQAIHRAYDCGLLQQASLMVTGPAVGEAVRIAKQCPGLSVGLHLTLCSGHALNRSRLTDANRRLLVSPLLAGLRYAIDPRLEQDLASEISAQFAAFRRLGLDTAHWDGHCAPAPKGFRARCTQRRRRFPLRAAGTVSIAQKHPGTGV